VWWSGLVSSLNVNARAFHLQWSCSCTGVGQLCSLVVPVVCCSSFPSQLQYCHSKSSISPILQFSLRTPKPKPTTLSRWPAQHASLRSQPHPTPCARRSKAYNQSTRPTPTTPPTRRALLPSTLWTATSRHIRRANDHSTATTTRLRPRISHRPFTWRLPNRRRKYHSQTPSRAHATRFCPRLTQEKEV